MLYIQMCNILQQLSLNQYNNYNYGEYILHCFTVDGVTAHQLVTIRSDLFIFSQNAHWKKLQCNKRYGQVC